ncbi:Heterokaryon incompatibility protein 6 [Metarhizium rileyi]|uniref:Heterokaryon incompatibility protein 6 n=1 Tax=Metarhizium rileyi (strain RCEF 4871) TaxID=1649241 RepID=A0A167KI10_METRR|nr:Heterokaryon incompatibility protein 6 [Metarhizium rileyi RCEF 4871]
MEEYRYEPLPLTGKNVRLVVLHPRVPSVRPQDIRVTIRHTPLEVGRRLLPSFMALSYVSGDAADRRDITVVESTDADPGHLASARRLSVTASLAEALGHVPYADSHIILWVDAICINQEDLDERAQHVSLMAEIYASAERVLAWTGPSTQNSNVAVNLLHRIADSIDVDFASLEMRPKESRWTRESGTASMYFQLMLDPHFALPWDGPESQALEAFLGRPWFERLWTRQEMTLGASDAVLLCGSSSIGWAKFRKAAVFLNRKVKDPHNPRFPQWTARTALVADTAVHGASQLGHLLRQMQRTECADPRDRIYGVMGILPTASRALAQRMRPDYRKPVVDVYKELVLCEMEVARRADLLSECRLAGPTSPDWRPSWVPNWTARRERDLSMTHQCADGRSACVHHDGQSSTLTVEGVLAATVIHVLPIVIARGRGPEEPIIPSAVSLIKGVAARLDLSEGAAYRPSRGSSTLEALCYALSGGRLTDHVAGEMTDATTPSMAQFKRFVKFALDFAADGAPVPEPSQALWSDVLLCIGSMVHACEDRSLLLTEEGFVGTGPTLARPGDQISVVLGCMRPLVLRAQKDDAGHSTTHVVVGPCHAHGLNWGEALLGSLPEGVNLAWSPSGPDRDARPVFRNPNTGQDTVADPRVDWDLVTFDAGDDGSAQRAGTADGKGTGATVCRRLDAEYFHKKGVKLSSLTLV